MPWRYQTLVIQRWLLSKFTGYDEWCCGTFFNCGVITQTRGRLSLPVNSDSSQGSAFRCLIYPDGAHVDGAA